MSSMSHRNSAAAQAYAEKKKAALEKANRLAAERRRKQELQAAASVSTDDRTSLDRYQSGHIPSRNIIGSAGGAEVESVFSNDFAERLVIRPSQRSSMNSDISSQHAIEPRGNMRSTAFAVERERERERVRSEDYCNLIFLLICHRLAPVMDVDAQR